MLLHRDVTKSRTNKIVSTQVSEAGADVLNRVRVQSLRCIAATRGPPHLLGVVTRTLTYKHRAGRPRRASRHLSTIYNDRLAAMT